MHIFLPCFNTNSLTLQISVYQVITALKCDYSSQIYLARGFLLRGKLSGLAQVSPSSKYSNVWSGCCKSMLCPDKSYHVSGDEQRNVFWPELAKLPPQLYSLNYSLGKQNTFFGSCKLCPPKHRNLVSKNIQARLPPAFVSDPLIVTQREDWTVDQVLSEALSLWIFKRKMAKSLKYCKTCL